MRLPLQRLFPSSSKSKQNYIKRCDREWDIKRSFLEHKKLVVVAEEE